MRNADSRVTGLLLAFELLVERLSQSGAVDRAEYVQDLKTAYNSLSDRHAESDGAQLLHDLARHLEHGIKKKG